MSSSTVGVFEMLWDCAYCDTKALLGATNRFCPQCGAPQDATRRSFPPEGQETPSNHTFDGADLTCPACATPNGAKAVHCRHCGSPLDGSAQVKRVEAVGEAVAAAALPLSKAPGKRWPWVLAGLLALMVVTVCNVAVFWKKAADVTVTSHAWSRTIDIEALEPVGETAWCDSMPADAYGVSRRREQRSTNKRADGETCTTHNVDLGNGTFERRQDCQPKYREEPVYDERCSFTVNRWRTERTLRSAGQGTAEAPTWPAVSLLGGGSSKREGARHETYDVALRGPKGEAWSCTLPAATWLSLRDGETQTVKVSVVLGRVDCDSLSSGE